MNPFPGRRRTIIQQRQALVEPKHEEVQAPVEEKPAPVSLVGVHDCPKCGKHVKRGMYMHLKWCKGK